MANNFTTQNISRQISTQSGQIAIEQNQGSYEFVDQLTGKKIQSQPVDSSMLSVPKRFSDPKLKARALDLARGLYGNGTVPTTLVENIATVAAYVSATDGIPISDLITNTGISKTLLKYYNSFREKSSQVGMFSVTTSPTWSNNPTLRGSIAAATVQP